LLIPGITFTQKTADEIATELAAQQAAISPYWDYTKISAPLTYTFKVVGVLEEQGSRSSYIPQSFATQLMHDYIQNQLDARTTTDIATTDLGSTYMGVEYDGVQLNSDTNQLAAMGINVRRLMRPSGTGRPGETASTADTSSTPSYNIPGLILTTERSTGNFRGFGGGGTVTGISTDPDVYTKAAVTSSTILLKVDSVFNRSSVVDALNKAGYAYQDLSKTKVIEELKSTLNWVSGILLVAFITLSVIIVVFTMGKFVSESRKEIGIFRAIGVTRNGIKLLFISQALLYALVGYAIGLAVGLATTVGVSGPAYSWFDSLIGKTIAQSFNVVTPVNSSVFTTINWQAIGIYSGILLAVTLIVSFIPASRAAAISPVEAIRSE